VRVAVTALSFVLLTCANLGAQETTSLTRADNPLAELHDTMVGVFAAANVPFSEDQERAVVLMMEERQRASEDLFGDLMDFREGPTRGRDSDRLRSAIAWLRGEFLAQIVNYLTDEQLTEWRRVEASLALEATEAGTVAEPPAETQLVRINNNSFTAEDNEFRRGGRGTEVIPRGGSGAFHGTMELFVKDDALNARNAFASNKPPYQERQVSADFGGPLIAGRLTTTVSVRQNESKNVDTINATLADGSLFALGITRPQTQRNIGTQSVAQLADAHSLRINVRRNTNERENQDIGGFRLPERASSVQFTNWNSEIRQFSTFGSDRMFESRLQLNAQHGERIPVSDAIRIDVLDAFGSGGSQNAGGSEGRNYSFGSLFTRYGPRLTVKVGFDGNYQRNRSVSTSNFGGTYTFSSLAAFNAGTPLFYRVNQGDPVLETTQLQLGGFVQNDLQITPRLTLMFGVRYDGQTNLDDRNNVAPRASLAYAVGRSVIRGGGGLFYNRLDVEMVQTQRRFDGTRQREIVIENPSYPDPFVAGLARESIPSVRVTDPALKAPEVTVAMLSYERTFFRGLYLTATYDYQRETNRYRLRNLNAPRDITQSVPTACTLDLPAELCLRPDPAQGNILNLESTANERRHGLQVNVRQRFSIFNVSANYSYQHVYADALPWDSAQLATDSYDLRADWARADFPTHQMSASVNARLPFGVFLAGQMSARSARYYTITTGQDDNRDTNVNDRPLSVPRNSEEGPGFYNWDFNLSKAFFLPGGGKNINVFANVTNAFNWVHYGTPSGVITSPNFGRSTSAQNPREFEVGLRFQF
jgi:outer membrane receptor protein involved in Fe transport